MLKKNSSVDQPRLITYKILLKFLSTFNSIDILFNKLITESKDKDIPFIKELVYGTIRNKKYIDQILKNISNIKINKIDKKTYTILLIGSYQIIYMKSIPSYASIYTSVEMSKYFVNRSYKFINAVLRNVNRDYDKHIVRGDDLDSLSILYSYPFWLIKKWKNQFNEDIIKDICKNSHYIPRKWLRINSLKISSEKIFSFLDAENISYEIDKKFDIFFNINKFNDYIYKLLDSGYLYVQNPSSGFVVKLFTCKTNDTLLDVCSAPGGKLTLLNQLMSNSVHIYANELFTNRLDRLKENVNKLGIENVQFSNVDALKLDLNNKYDHILVDAPCSATGTISKNPDVKWRVTQNKINLFAVQQYSMINFVSKFLKVGGSLIYSSCSLEIEENDLIIKKFLKENKNFVQDNIEHLVPNEYINDNGNMLILPNKLGYEGMFASKLTKNE